MFQPHYSINSVTKGLQGAHWPHPSFSISSHDAMADTGLGWSRMGISELKGDMNDEKCRELGNGFGIEEKSRELGNGLGIEET